MQAPLQGVRVVEFGGNVAAPTATWVLVELGAEVIKVERPGGGDDARGWGPPFYGDDASIFHTINRGKKSITVDMNDAAALERLQNFITSDVDVVLQNLRAGICAKFGVDGATLRQRNPRLIYCNLHAFGASGPLKDRPGYDALMQAVGGIMSLTGEADGPPVRCGISVIDQGTALWCVIGIISALLQRGVTGKGAEIDTSLYETALTWMGHYVVDYQITGTVPPRRGSGVRGITPYEAYQCADGQLMIAAPNDRLFRRLATALGHGDWADDPRFATSGARSTNREILNAAIVRALLDHGRKRWQAVLDQAGVPNAPIQTVDEVLVHPQTVALDIFRRLGGAGPAFPGIPVQFDGTRFRSETPTPVAGEHTYDILPGAAGSD